MKPLFLCILAMAHSFECVRCPVHGEDILFEGTREEFAKHWMGPDPADGMGCHTRFRGPVVVRGGEVDRSGVDAGAVFITDIVAKAGTPPEVLAAVRNAFGLAT
jgi:hypothetical protein